jgi:hypothetical protein
LGKSIQTGTCGKSHRCPNWLNFYAIWICNNIRLSGVYTATDAGIGAGVDSYFEYLVKGALLFQRPNLMKQFYGMVFICLI